MTTKGLPSSRLLYLQVSEGIEAEQFVGELGAGGKDHKQTIVNQTETPTHLSLGNS